MNITRERFGNTADSNSTLCVKDRQEQQKKGFTKKPETALITDMARTSSSLIPATTALYSEVIPGHDAVESYAVGVHRAVGGMSDYATPGDILCAAIAACLDSTLRIVANRLAIPLRSLSVCVRATVDVRGTLRMNDDVPVGFQEIEIEVDMQTQMRLPENTIGALLRAAEHSCVVLQTLRKPPNISMRQSSSTEAFVAA